SVRGSSAPRRGRPFRPSAASRSAPRWSFAAPARPASETSGPGPAVRRRSCPRTRPGGCRSTVEPDRPEGTEVAPGARIAEVSFDQRTQAEPLVQLAREQQPRVGRDGGAAELDAKLRIEREANRGRFCVTHWMMPSATREAPQKPAGLAGAE